MAAAAATVVLGTAMVGVAGAATVSVPCAGPGGGAAGLVAAVAVANTTTGADTIDLAAGCSYVLAAPAAADNGLPVVTGELTVRGHGATIRRSSPTPFRILEVAPGGDLTLDQVTIAGGLVALSGPTAFGGGILNGGELTVTRSTISDNTVSGTGSSAGGGGIANNGTATLTDTVLRNNQALASGTFIFAGVGGAVLNRTGAVMTISGSTVTANTALSRGSSEILFIASAGGIGNSGTLAVSGTQVVGNRAVAAGRNGRGNGGGLSIAGGIVTFTGGAVVGNTALATGVGASAHGGGVETFGRTKLSGTTVRSNVASGPEALGGGIFNGRRLTMVRGVVTANVAAGTAGPGRGGGIFSESGRVILHGTDVFANQPDDCEPAIPGC
ncbi:MAG: hypothetical protein ACR2HV_08220 [Acidimicrobiales bacterium]